MALVRKAADDWEAGKTKLPVEPTPQVLVAQAGPDVPEPSSLLGTYPAKLGRQLLQEALQDLCTAERGPLGPKGKAEDAVKWSVEHHLSMQQRGVPQGKPRLPPKDPNRPSTAPDGTITVRKRALEDADFFPAQSRESSRASSRPSTPGSLQPSVGTAGASAVSKPRCPVFHLQELPLLLGR